MALSHYAWEPTHIEIYQDYDEHRMAFWSLALHPHLAVPQFVERFGQRMVITFQKFEGLSEGVLKDVAARTSIAHQLQLLTAFLASHGYELTAPYRSDYISWDGEHALVYWLPVLRQVARPDLRASWQHITDQLQVKLHELAPETYDRVKAYVIRDARPDSPFLAQLAQRPAEYVIRGEQLMRTSPTLLKGWWQSTRDWFGGSKVVSA